MTTRIGHHPGVRHRAFTLVELVVAMAVALILAVIGYTVYLGQVANAHTVALEEELQKLYSGMLSAQSSLSGGFPTDTSNQSGTANVGEESYDALVADLTAAGTVGLLSTTTEVNIVTSSWAYEPINDTSPPTFTITARAQGGSAHVLCVDQAHGVVDLGAGMAPAVVGVRCR